MKVYEIVKGSTSFDGLRKGERPDPEPGPHQVQVRVRACSLNYRDLAVATGNYFGGTVPKDLVPLSDGAGEVVAVGDGVTRFKVGDRVAATFFQVWIDGPPAFGKWWALGANPLDGMLAEYVVLHEDGLVGLPEHLSFEEAAALPCAGVTAWHGLFVAGRRVKAGDNVLVIGTGGVSMLAAQFAHAAGARVIATSSSDEKLARAKKLGVSEGINYRTHPDWEKEVMRLTNGHGADIIIESAGAGTLAKSFQSVAFTGKIALIGVLAREGDTNPHGLMMKGAALQGIFVGNRAMFEEMLRAIEVNRIKPIVDRVFDFNEAREAYDYLAAGRHFGKLVIRI